MLISFAFKNGFQHIEGKNILHEKLNIAESFFFFLAFLTAKNYFSKCETQKKLLGTFPKSNL